MNKIENELFRIKSNILNMAFFGGHLCNGYINLDEYSKSRAILTYLVKDIFNITRFPGFEEHYLSNTEIHHRQAFMALNMEDIQEAKEELESLYRHTQSFLKEKYPNKSHIKIGRALNQVEEKQVTNQLLDTQKKDEDIVQFESNVILSFADQIKQGDYASKVLLRTEVPFEKILMHYDCLYYPSGTTGEEKENEILVINSNPFGRVIRPKGEYKSKNLVKRDSRYFHEYDYPMILKPQNVDFYNYEYAFNKHLNVWNDPWVQRVIKLRRKLGKLQ